MKISDAIMNFQEASAEVLITFKKTFSLHFSFEMKIGALSIARMKKNLVSELFFLMLPSKTFFHVMAHPTLYFWEVAV